MLDEKSDPLEEKVDPVEKPDPLEEKVDPVEKEELDPCKQVPSACADVPAGQLTGPSCAELEND